MKKPNCLSTFALSFLRWLFHPNCWNFFFYNTSRLNEWILDSVIITTFEWEVCAWWNSKFCTYSFEQRCVIIIYVAESWVTMKSQFTLNSTHLKENPSDVEVDAKHHKQLDLFWNLIENFTRYSTACSCASYCEVELSRPITHIWPCKQSLWFYAQRMLSFCPCEYSSEFCLEVLIWGNKDLYLLVEVADSILIKWNWSHLLS